MSYVDARQYGENIYVSERTDTGQRRIRNFETPSYCYIEDPEGTHTSIMGESVSKVEFTSYKEMKIEVEALKAEGYRLFESDILPFHKVLEEHYAETKPPKLHIAILDIEVDTKIEKGWASFSNPYAPINAVTVTRKWLNDTITIALCPETLTMEEATEMVSDMEDTFVVETEEELLILFLDLIKDTDVTTGWNSKFFDMPYIVARIRMVLGGEAAHEIQDPESRPSRDSMVYLKKMCLFKKIPKLGFAENYGSLQAYFDFPGIPHMDYLDLYMKFTQNQKHTYKLDYILRIEVEQTKVPYEGTLEQLYRNDFKLFCQYNRQDTLGLDAIDEKLGYINLANETAHSACVLLPSTLKSVLIIEQALTVECHRWKGLVVPDKDVTESSSSSVAGAMVFLPEGGLEEHVMSVDLTSLYPSVLRLLNISPETVIGQFDTSRTEEKIKKLISDGKAKTRTEAWHYFTGVSEYHDIIDGSEEELTLVFEDGNKITQSGKEWNDFFKADKDLCVSANGTVFDTSREGLISYCLTKWFKERKEYKEKSQQLFKENNEEEGAYWDRIQNARKLFLNSTYGALLNRFFRFYDQRFGQSTTLSGRVITTHMAKQANSLLGYDYQLGGALVAGDTDSVYMRMDKKLKDLKIDPEDIDEIVKLADSVGDNINASFPQMAIETFFVPESRSNIIQAKREVVARRGLFKNAKKRYALFVVDEEGKRKNKLKIMGMDNVRSDTPEYIQDFLEEIIKMLVQENRSKEYIMEKINEFRTSFRNRNPWKMGKSMRVSNLTLGAKKRKLFEEGKIPNPRLNYSVIAADNTNKYIKYFNEQRMDVIHDGEKVEILDLKQDPIKNPLGLEYIAIPVAADYVPEWFANLPIDKVSMEEKLITKKLENTLGVLGWDLVTEEDTSSEIFT